MRRSRSKVYRKKSSRRTTRWLRSWMAWRDSSWRPSLFGWLGESTGQALGNFQTPSWLVVTWTKPAEETSSQTLSLSLSSLSHRRLTARPSPSIFFIRRCHFNFFFLSYSLSLSTTKKRRKKKLLSTHSAIQEISSQNKPRTASSGVVLERADLFAETHS